MSPASQLFALGLSFRTAPVAVREALSFSPDAAHGLLTAAARALPGVELTLLSTCNRTEFYLAAPPAQSPVEHFLKLLKELRPSAPALRPDCERYCLQGEHAARHLFRIATGLDSAILGDGQILGQVKGMLGAATRAGTLGATLHETLVQAIKAGKQARSSTEIGYGAASVGSAIVSLLSSHEQSLREANITPRVLILGAGAMAVDIGRHAAKAGQRQVTFVSRTAARATATAAECGGTAGAWTDLPALLSSHHFVIAATSCPKPIVTCELLAAARAALTPGAPCPLRLIVDAGMPRNVATDVPLPTVDIDGIQDLRELALARRAAAIPAVNHIVEAAVRRWRDWLARRPVEQVIKALYLEAARESLAAVAAVPGGDPAVQHSAALTLHRGMRRVLRGHARHLRRRHPLAELETVVTCS